jgi:hypothetical protein
MSEQFKSQKYYLMCVLCLLAIYTWTSVKGVSFYGDDNTNRSDHSHPVSGGGHAFIYYHK